MANGEDYEFWPEGGKRCLLSVALTEKSAYFVFGDSGRWGDDSYEVFDYFEDFIGSDDILEELKSMVAAEISEDYVEFLDI